MTATLDDVTKKIKPEPTAEQVAAEELVRRAREQGLSLTGPDGLLKQLTKTVLETALNQELTEHLGHEKHGQPAEPGNIRNGTRPKTVLTEAPARCRSTVPRDRAGSFEPQIVRKRQRRLTGWMRWCVAVCQGHDDRGYPRALRGDLRGVGSSARLIARITDKVMEEMQEWQSAAAGSRSTPVISSTRSMVKVRVLSLIMWRGQWARSTRFRRRSRLARPNIWRLSILIRLLLPSTGPEL